ncbi:hypothetical protein B1756_12910 [Natrarchaeobaculum aegyptiacum]|uniref:Uncharacterized protein n=1 Tax=Natrarchaeobaculum aegyptiacum TaxID=745377 RepID=A0A2Z2HTH8_9EURY|nr:hypothetical protein B1756_12910 [Natrarchaeobaculum aegyptiacum]
MNTNQDTSRQAIFLVSGTERIEIDRLTGIVPSHASPFRERERDITGIDVQQWWIMSSRIVPTVG